MGFLRAALLTGAIALGMCVPGHADLVGTSVTGSIVFDTTAPLPGYTSAPVTVGSGPEFVTSYIVDTISADFAGNQLTLQDWVLWPQLGAFGWTQTFTDAAFANSTVSLISQDYGGGGVSFSQSGDTLTFNWAGIGWLAQDPIYTASFRILPGDPLGSSVPEPSGLALLLSASAVLALLLFRERRVPA